MKNLGHKIRIAGDWAPCDKSVCTVLNKSGLILNIEGPILTNGTEGYEKQINDRCLWFLNQALPYWRITTRWILDLVVLLQL